MPVYTLCKLYGVRPARRDADGRDRPRAGAITGKWKDIGRFKGPILRGLSGRAPYFHNGAAATLADVVTFYDTRFELGLSEQQKADLVAFLKALYAPAVLDARRHRAGIAGLLLESRDSRPWRAALSGLGAATPPVRWWYHRDQLADGRRRGRDVADAITPTPSEEATMARMEPLGIQEVDDEIRHLCEETERQSGTSASARTYARNPGVLKALTAFRAALAREGTLDPVLRELVRLKIAALNACRYRLTVRYAGARHAGATEAKIAAINDEKL